MLQNYNVERRLVPHNMVSIAFASTLGAVIELYDFFLYGVLAPIALRHVFFPDLSPLIGTLAAYTTFAVGFISRPVGGIIFGHFGDKLGRKKILVLTLLIMGISTFLVGVLPGAPTSGVAAPLLLLLLRVLQGIGLGGEWGGAVLMMVEHAPDGKRGFYGSWPQLGAPIGLLASAGVVALVSLLPNVEFINWGWRIPFLLSAVLVAVGLFVRLRVMETPEFQTAKEEGRIVNVPILEVLRSSPKSLILALGAHCVEGACFNIFGVFAIAYIVGVLHWSRDFALACVMVSAALMVPFIILFGAAADRIGAKRVFGVGCVAIALTTFGSFTLMQWYGADHAWVVLLGVVVPFSIAYPMVFGPESSLLASQFDAHVRYTGISFAYQFSGIFASGLTPLVATALLAAGGGKPWLVVTYMIAICILSLLSVAAMRASLLQTSDWPVIEPAASLGRE